MAAENQTDIAEIEACLLGLCLSGAELAEELPNIPAGSWSSDINELAWCSIAKLHRDGIRVPSDVEIVGAMGERMAPPNRANAAKYLRDCALIAPVTSARALPRALDEHARCVREAAAMRALRVLGDGIAAMAQDGSLSAPEVLAKVDGELDRLRIADRLEFTSLRAIATQLVDDLERPRRLLPTGLDAINRVLGGGLWTGQLYGLAARMKTGKTLALGTIARNVARQGHKVLFVALEMGARGIAQRLVADGLQINAMAFLRRDDAMLSERVAGYACKASAELDCLLWHNAPGLTFERLRGVCQVAAQQGVELLVLDYWQLVQGAAKGQTETQHLGAVAQWLADFAQHNDIAVLTAAQINRSGETRGSDGLRLACDWYANLHPAKPNSEQDRWLEVLDCRYMPRLDVGSETDGVLYVDSIGPVLREVRR